MKKKILIPVLCLVGFVSLLIAATLPSLTDLPTITDDDIFYVVDDPGGTAADRKATLANLNTSLHDGVVDGGSVGSLTNFTGGEFEGDLTVRGQHLTADGSAVTPSIAPITAPTSGLYFGANQTRFTYGGVQSAWIGVAGFGATTDNAGLYLGAAGDAVLRWDAANILAQRNTVNAQDFRIYGTWTDASNYERLSLSADGSANTTIEAETAGTGADDIDITITPAGAGNVSISTGSLTVTGGITNSPVGAPADEMWMGGTNMAELINTGGGADNLGDHTATEDINFGGFSAINTGGVALTTDESETIDWTTNGPAVTTYSTNAAFAISFSGSPADMIQRTLILTNTSGSPLTLTIPSSYSIADSGNITTHSVQASSVAEYTWLRANAAYLLWISEKDNVELTALASNTDSGLWARTGTGTGAAREITAGSARVTVTNGDGVAANPEVDVPANLAVTTITGAGNLDGGYWTNATYLSGGFVEPTGATASRMAMIGADGGVTNAAAATGTGAPVLATSPTLVTPAIGAATATTASADDNDTSVATTAFVQGEIAEANRGQFGITIDGGGSAITTGFKGYIRVPYNMTITGVEVVADQSGSIVVDLWKETYANLPHADGDSITASAPPTLSTAQKSQDQTLTGWTTDVTVGDYVGFNVDSAATVELVHIAVYGTKD